MKNTTVLLLALASFGLAAIPAKATNVDLEDIAVGAGTNNIGGDHISQGFVLDSSANHTHLINDTGGFAAWNGTTTLQVDDIGGANALTLSKIGGGAFSLSSVDFGEGALDFQRANNILVTGNIFSGGSVSLIVTLDGIFDQNGPLLDFQTQFFGAGWGNLVSVSFDAVEPFNNSNYLVDNINVGTVRAPDSGNVLVMFGAVLAASAFAARRRKIA